MTAKPTVYISTKATDLTNQANVSAQLFDRISDQAGREVWDAAPEDWMMVAERYVNLRSWDLYGTRWHAPEPPMPLSPLTDMPSPVPAASYTSLPISEGQSAIQKIKRFLGFRNGS